MLKDISIKDNPDEPNDNADEYADENADAGDENADAGEKNDDMDEIINGKETTNRHDADGNLVDKDGNRIEWDDGKSWGTFVKSLVRYFFLSLLIGLCGSGFIYLTSRGGELDNILPLDGSDFYEKNPLGIKVSGPASDINCVSVPMGSTQKFINNFPYYLKGDDDLNAFLEKGKNKETGKGGPGLSERFKRWFARTTMGAFVFNRQLLTTWFENFQPNTPLGNQTFQIYVGFTVSMFLSQFVPFCTGLFGAAAGAFGADPVISIVGIFLGWTWIMVIGLAIIMYLRFLFTILLLPLVLNWKEVANIMACNAKSIAILFGYFACGAAYDNLDSTISGMMGIVFLGMVIYSIKNYFSEE